MAYASANKKKQYQLNQDVFLIKTMHFHQHTVTTLLRRISVTTNLTTYSDILNRVHNFKLNRLHEVRHYFIYFITT